MATNENKVQFNIKNVHYAVMTADGDRVFFIAFRD